METSNSYTIFWIFISGNDWHNIEKFDVTVGPDKNVMAIKAVDWGGYHGFSATLNNGTCKSMTIDDIAGWKCTETYYLG